ncbi:tRNA-guanine(15) transglycosylase-like protein, partial [Jimgerdemannia flammicorona]
MASTLTYTLRKASSATATTATDLRRGSLTLVKPDGTITLETPNCLAYTVRGTVPHLTPDNLRLLPCEAVQITLEQFFEEASPSSLKYPGGLHKFLHMEVRPSLFSLPPLRYSLPNLSTPTSHSSHLRDPTSHHPTVSANTDKFVSVTTHGGVRQVTSGLYAEVMSAYQPDVLVSLADVVMDERPSLKRVRKSVDRTGKWLDEALKARKVDIQCVRRIGTTHIFAVLVGSHIKDERIRAAQMAATRGVGGFVLNAHGLGTTAQERVDHLKVSLVEVPEEKPRVAYGFGRPEDVLVAVANGLDLFDS